MAKGKRRFWWSIGFAVGFAVRDLMEEESCVRRGLRNFYHDTLRFFDGCCCRRSDEPHANDDRCGPDEPTDE